MPTIQEKKDFIRYLLKKHEPKRRECVWILSYITSDVKLLEKVRFTDDARSKPLGMVIGFQNTDVIPFRYYIGNVMSADVEKVFHKLRLLGEDEKMYIELNYPSKHQDERYWEVAEAVKSEVPNVEMDNLMQEINAMRLEEYINQALDSNNKELFYQLTGGQPQ